MNALKYTVKNGVFEINENFIILNSEKISISEIHQFRFGIYVETVNGIRTKRSYNIGFKDIEGFSIEVECHKFLRSNVTVKKIFNEILIHSFKNVLPMILSNLNYYLINNIDFFIGQCLIKPDGIECETGFLFWRRKHKLKWDEIDFKIENGYLKVLSIVKFNKTGNSDDVNTIAKMDIQYTWNAVIFETLKNFAISKNYHQIPLDAMDYLNSLQ